MKIKTKYNVGDVVEYRKIWNNYNFFGIIRRIIIEYSVIGGTSIDYECENYVNVLNGGETFIVKEYEIKQKLHKKSFAKAYAEECARFCANNGVNEKVEEV